MARLLRALLIVLFGVLIVAGAAQVSRGWGGAAFVLVAFTLFALFVLLPRAAHGAFEQGRFRRAARLYKLLRAVVVDPTTRAAIDVSLAGCRLAAEDWPGALEDLAHVSPDELGPSARAAFLNNRAYANARGRLDASSALRDIDEAMTLRPDVAGFRHTRGLALYALGRLDDAIVELDGMWRKMGGDEAPPLLEAERCFDLGEAWLAKGEAEYAVDYFQRARTVAPGSPWARDAGARLRRLGNSRDDAHTGMITEV